MKTILKKHDKSSIGLIGHTVIDFPSPDVAREVVDVMVEEGVSLIELQIPFSEPVADGPVFVEANQRALEAGVGLEQCFAFMKDVTRKHDIPFVFVTYLNIVFKHGFEAFVRDAKAAGASGAIIPDLPIENAGEYLRCCEEADFAMPQLIPPNMKDARLTKVAKAASGFIYAVARSGVTGKKTNFSEQFPGFIERIQKQTDLPIAVGFGIRDASDIETLKLHADYAIVGTQAFRVLTESGVDGLRLFWHDLFKATS